MALALLSSVSNVVGSSIARLSGHAAIKTHLEDSDEKTLKLEHPIEEIDEKNIPVQSEILEEHIKRLRLKRETLCKTADEIVEVIKHFETFPKMKLAKYEYEAILAGESFPLLKVLQQQRPPIFLIDYPPAGRHAAVVLLTTRESTGRITKIGMAILNINETGKIWRILDKDILQSKDFNKLQGLLKCEMVEMDSNNAEETFISFTKRTDKLDS